MSTDLFDHLAEDNIPEPPDEFDQEFHTRLNRTLLTIQTFEMCIRALLSTGCLTRASQLAAAAGGNGENPRPLASP